MSTHCNHCDKEISEYIDIVENGERIRICEGCFNAGLKAGVFLYIMVVDTNIKGLEGRVQ